MKVSVSDLQISDRSDWIELYGLYAEFYQMPMNVKILDMVWYWVFDESNKFYAKIARREDGLALGILHYREMPSPLRGELVGFVDDIYVKAEYRGLGVIDSLFDALSQSAKDNDWSFVRWITADNNYRARAVYDKVSDRTQWLTYQMNLL